MLSICFYFSLIHYYTNRASFWLEPVFGPLNEIVRQPFTLACVMHGVIFLVKNSNMKIAVILYKTNTLANGEHPLMVRITQNKTRKYISLGIPVTNPGWIHFTHKFLADFM